MKIRKCSNVHLKRSLFIIGIRHKKNDRTREREKEEVLCICSVSAK